MTPKKNVYAIVGPTCTHKTELSIALSKAFPVEVISADSRLVYKYMNIGTAKPSLAEQDQVKHHMIDLVEPNQDYSVSLYKNQAEKIIEDVFQREKIPVFVGGTGLYLNAVLSGFSIPQVEPDPEYRSKLKEKSTSDLYVELKSKDSVAASTIHENDAFRIIRALEVIEKTGVTFSSQKNINDLPFNVIWIGLTYEDRNEHAKLLKLRAKNFLTNGFLDEVKHLINKYGSLDLFKNTIGYAEGMQLLAQKITEEEFVEHTTLSTRQFAKRQRTWFRKNKDIKWFDFSSELKEKIFNEISQLIGLSV